MVDGWEWDSTLFEGAAEYYQRGRLPYAPGLTQLLAEVLRLDGHGRLLDVGCGPGTLALSLASVFGQVVGVDADAAMIAEAERQAAATGVADRSRWVHARAEELPADLGTFTAAIFGNSFHWMDRDLVAATMVRLLEPGGALVHVSDLKSESRDAHTDAVDGPALPAPPGPAIDELVRTYLGPVRRAGQGVIRHGTPSGEAEILSRAGFTGPDRFVLPGGQLLEREAEDVVAFVFSLSSSAPHLFGEQRGAFEADLLRLLREASPSGRFAERVPSTEAFVWRRAAA